MIDLHVHSNASDGTLTPSQVADEAIKAGLSAIALTDHDTLDGIPEILEHTKDTDLEIIPGIELSCFYNDHEIHILGLFADYENAEFNTLLHDFQQSRINRNLKMIELFQNDGIDVTMEKLLHGNPDSVITRAHFARVLMEEGVVRTKEQAFKKYIGAGCKYYLPREKVSCEDAIKILGKYCRLSVLAHPLIYKMGYRQIEELLVHLKSLGLDGMECYHSSNNSYESMRLREYAAKYNLLVSGGSDFHGENKPDISLGKGRGGLCISDRILDDMKKYISAK